MAHDVPRSIGDGAHLDAGGPGVAVLDACVLYGLTMRGVLLNLAQQGAFRPVWSDRILSETGNSLLRDDRLRSANWRRLERTLRQTFPEALAPAARVTELERAMTNHPKDRHVLAAAVATGATTVITTNLKDFRAADLAPTGVVAMHPDAFLVGMLERSPRVVSRALDGHLADMHADTRWTRGQLLGQLAGMGRGAAQAPRFAARAQTVLGTRAATPPPPPERQNVVARGRSRPSRGQER